MEAQGRDEYDTSRQMPNMKIKPEPVDAAEVAGTIADVNGATTPSNSSTAPDPLREQSSHLMKHGLLQAIIDQGYLARSQNQRDGSLQQASMLTSKL